MAAAAKTAAAEGEAPKKKGKLPIIVAGVLLLAGGGGGAWFMGLFGGGGAAEAAAAHGGAEDGGHGGEAARPEAGGHGEAQGGDGHGGPPAAQGPAFVSLPDIVVNLQGTGKRTHFMKLRVSLEVGGAGDEAAIQGLMPRVMDSFQLYLRSLTPRDVEGAPGLQRLKEEMLARINHAIEPVRVADVLVKEMLVQ
ncbi:MAG: flagellar basal body-associated FliL family protein [Geminicoccaceae bacterium]|nr:flagellar basal body-associated FliL family protein [Geminicoccaceae bacterium]